MAAVTHARKRRGRRKSLGCGAALVVMRSSSVGGWKGRSILWTNSLRRYMHAEHEKYMLGILVFMPKHEKYIEPKSSNS